MNLQDFIDWFTDLKNMGVKKDEVLDVLEFDSDVEPDFAAMLQAKELVYAD